jgi:hypothetical protein
LYVRDGLVVEPSGDAVESGWKCARNCAENLRAPASARRATPVGGGKFVGWR